MRTLVIGGGVAGIVTAMAMQKGGIDATVYEAYDRSAVGVGACMTLAVNGLNTLDVLGLKDIVAARSFDAPQVVHHSANGEQVGEHVLGATEHAVYRAMRRSDLYVVLRDEAVRRDIPIEYDKRLTNAQRSGDQVVAQFADGTEATGDLLVGADGVHSRVRQVIDPDSPSPRYAGVLNIGGVATGVEVDGAPGVMHLVFGNRCLFFYLKAPDGTVWWFANPASATEPDRATLDNDSETWQAKLVRLLSADRTPAADIVKATPEPYPPLATYDLPPVPTWHRDRMVIIGDAAHAALPVAGQAASMAIEDAVVLAKCVRDIPQVDQALQHYELQRRERVETIVAIGEDNNPKRVTEPVFRMLQKFILQRASHHEIIENRQHELWDYSVDWHTPMTFRHQTQE
jgi:2-polyprenyl-6-methoxyphenol hydroxylase-like FAD-dependent oxidoreductase